MDAATQPSGIFDDALGFVSGFTCAEPPRVPREMTGSDCATLRIPTDTVDRVSKWVKRIREDPFCGHAKEIGSYGALVGDD